MFRRTFPPKELRSSFTAGSQPGSKLPGQQSSDVKCGSPAAEFPGYGQVVDPAPIMGTRGYVPVTVMVSQNPQHKQKTAAQRG